MLRGYMKRFCKMLFIVRGDPFAPLARALDQKSQRFAAILAFPQGFVKPISAMKNSAHIAQAAHTKKESPLRGLFCCVETA
jgi:hypothetical protein